jgi:hypothetical protein
MRETFFPRAIEFVFGILSGSVVFDLEARGPLAFACPVKPVRAEQLFDVRGIAAIVTGVASGVGLACARVLAVDGARVILMDHDNGQLADVTVALAAAPAWSRTCRCRITIAASCLSWRRTKLMDKIN